MVTTTAPKLTLSIPAGDDFLQEDGEFTDFIDAPELAELGRQIINRDQRFQRIRDFEVAIRFLWKASGGVSGGKPIVGKCQKPGGLIKFLTRAHYVIWLAADHLSEPSVGDREIEACLFHELCHIHINDDGKFLIRGHDWAGFTAELQEYGLWNNDVTKIAKQLTLL